MDTTDQTNENREKMISDLKSVVKEAEDLLRKSGEQLGAGYESAKARFDSTMHSARTGFVSMEEQMAAQTREAMEATDRYVQENPWQAVGISAVAGLVLGYLITRK